MPVSVRRRCSVRAPMPSSRPTSCSVGRFPASLLSDQLASLLQEGNVRGARALIDEADKLASSTLSNAPAAELRLRWKLHEALVERLGDEQAALQQAERINRLLPRVTDDQL